MKTCLSKAVISTGKITTYLNATILWEYIAVYSVCERTFRRIVPPLYAGSKISLVRKQRVAGG
jgi:hypothetical protein